MKPLEIDTFIIAGSNAHKVKDMWGESVDEIICDTPFGRSHRIRLYELKGKRFGVIFRHGVGGYDITAPYVNYRANIYAAKKMGCRRIFSWTGPGAISEGYEIGDLVIPHDIIDFTKKRDYTFYEKKGLGFIRVNPCFCNTIRENAIKICESLNVRYHKKGVYVCTEGPRLETVAEIKMFRLLGGDMVGMTLVPEAFLARELEICYATICYITNYAESETLSYQEGELFEGTLPEEKKVLVDNVVSLFPDIMQRLLMTEDKGDCIYKKSIKKKKKYGKIGENFEDWI